MDTFFIGHGAPTLVVDDRFAARSFLRSWKCSNMLQETPKAILIVSAHWDTDEPTVTAVHGTNDTIYDFEGFPSNLYELKYPAPGAPALAQRVKELLTESGFEPVKEDKTRGLDHGAWVPLMLMYPEANIPVCQLSLQTEKGAEYHYRLGKALAPLKEDGVLVIGTGNIAHNLQALRPDLAAPVPEWASGFETWLKDSLLNGRYDDVNNYEEAAPYAKMNHPTPEHLLPLHVALGAAGHGSTAELIHKSWSKGVICHASYRFMAAKR